MPFPYSQVSPPPTAGILSVVDRANQNTPYAGGGGGGGVGTDIVVSSITINSAGLDGQYFPYNTTSTIGIGAGPTGNLIIGNQQGGVTPALTSGAQLNTGEIVLSGLTGDFGSQIQARVGADGQGNVQISSLYVSSINNAAPGGSVGPSLSVSTLFANDRIQMVGSATSSAALSFYKDATQNTYANMKYDATPGISSLAIYDAPGGNPGKLYVSGDLRVSSINGSAPGGGSAPFFSTLNQSPSTINCEPNVTTILLSFSTTASHLYQIQTQMTAQGWVGSGQEGTLNDDVVQEVLNEITLNTTQGSFISTANAAARDVGIGTCGMWKSNLTGTSLAINTTFSTTIQLGDVYLTDFGPV